MNGIDELEKAIKKLNIDLVGLVAETAIWADPSVSVDKKNDAIVMYPHLRRGKSGEKRDTIINGVKIDDNTYTNTAIKRACGINRTTLKNYVACHIWPDTCYDERFHTTIPNLVLIPNAIAGLSDFFDDVMKALQYHSYELYNWYPQGCQTPTKPTNYPVNWQKPHGGCIPKPNPIPTTCAEIDISIKNITIPLCKNKDEKIQDFVEKILKILFANNLIPEGEIEKLKDKAYCLQALGINYPLISSDKNIFIEKVKKDGETKTYIRCWANKIYDYYVCSQWWLQYEKLYSEKLSMWLKKIDKLNDL